MDKILKYHPLMIQSRYLLILSLGLCCIFCKNPQKTAVENAPSTTIKVTSIQAAINARQNGEWLKAAQLYEQLYLKDESNEEWNYEAGTNYLKANYPQKAIAILNNFDKKEEDTSLEFNGRIARIAKAYYQIGAYEKISKIVEAYAYPKMYRGLAREHLKALIQLNKPADLATAFSIYQQAGIYDDKGKQTNMGFLYRAICNELLIVGNNNLLSIYSAKYYNWAIARQEKDKRNLAIAAFYQQDFEQAITLLHTAISLEKSPRHQLELTGLLGICHAKQADAKNAQLQIEKIQNFQPLPNRHDAFGATFYHQARIEVALNQPAKAMEFLNEALGAKAEFWSNRFKEDGLLKALFEREDFEQLVRDNE